MGVGGHNKGKIGWNINTRGKGGHSQVTFTANGCGKIPKVRSLKRKWRGGQDSFFSER